MAMLLFALAATIKTTAGTCEINTADQQQTIRGFGTSYASGWNGSMTDGDADRLYGYANSTQMGLNILRVRVETDDGAYDDPNHSRWQDEVNNAKKVLSRAYKPIIFSSCWSPPPRMKVVNEIISRNGANKPKNWPYRDVAGFLGDYVEYMHSKGVNLYAVSIQNEPDIIFRGPDYYDACNWDWYQMKDFLLYNADSLKTTVPGFPVKVMAGESWENNTSYIGNIFSDNPVAAGKIDIVATHLYGGAYRNPAKHSSALAAGKEVWMTEHYIQDGYTKPIDFAVQTGEAIVKAMANAQMSAWVQWFPKGNNYRMLDASGNLTKLGYTMGQFARFVENGYRRIGTTVNPSAGIWTISYRSDVTNSNGTKRFVIVAVNSSTSAVPLQPFYFKGTPPGTTGEVWVTTPTSNFSKVSDVTVSNNGFARTLPAQSTTTFVFNF